MAPCESLKTAAVVTPCVCSVSSFFTDSRSACPIAHSSASKTSIRPVARWLRKALQPPLCMSTTAAPTLPSSDRDPSVHHIQTPAPTFASLSCPMYHLSFCRGVSAQYDRLDRQFFVQVGPAHSLCFSTSSMLFLDDSAYWRARRGVVVGPHQF